MHPGRRMAFVFTIVACSLVPAGAAQRRSTFSGHLSPLPANARESVTMQGKGLVNASLVDRTLTIDAKFEGLNSPATGATIRRAVPGLRGPVQFPLSVVRSTSGSIKTTLTLTPAQIDEVGRGWFYLQIDTEKNPEGHLRGWLLP